MAAGAAMAVESQVVGYETLDWMMKGEYYMMGMQFETTAGTAAKLADVNFGALSGPYYSDDDAWKTTAPQVQIAFATTEGNTAYYFLADGNETYDGPGWVDQTGGHADPDLDAAIGFWFRDPVSDKPTFNPAGQVMPDSPWSKTFTKVDYFMLVNPFPMDTKMSDISFSDLEKSAPYYSDDDAWKNTATQLQVPFATTEGFTAYYFLADGNETYDGPGWVDQTGGNVDITKVVIPAGRGCWFRPGAANMSVEFSLEK